MCVEYDQSQEKYENKLHMLAITINFLFRAQMKTFQHKGISLIIYRPQLASKINKFQTKGVHIFFFLQENQRQKVEYTNYWF